MKQIIITKEKGLKIIELSQKGIDQRIIGEKVGCSQATISRFIRAYNGNQEQFDLSTETAKKVITDIKMDEKAITTFPKYECRLFFGLIKITFCPVF